MNFERDVPEHMREDVCLAISEAATADGSSHGDVFIIERDWRDAINVRANGIITIGENEFSFIVRVGNHDGFQFEDWEGDKVFEPAARTEWTLAPDNGLIDRAIAAGRGPFLIWKWDASMKRPEVAKIPGSYMYDKHFQPGGAIERYWKAEAAKHQMMLVTTDEAREIRARLERAAVPPIARVVGI
jgi:hypothetical protein